jgi:hypothetical protein
MSKLGKFVKYENTEEDCEKNMFREKLEGGSAASCEGTHVKAPLLLYTICTGSKSGDNEGQRVTPFPSAFAVWCPEWMLCKKKLHRRVACKARPEPAISVTV